MANEQKQTFVTKEGYKKLEEELEYLITVKRKEVGLAIQKARAFGDLSENSEYDEAKNEQAEIEVKILKLEAAIKNAKIIDDSEITTDDVKVGCKVTVYDVTYDEECIYTIVGATEADPAELFISDESPLGKALLGHKSGDTVIIETPAGLDKLNIINIEKM